MTQNLFNQLPTNIRQPIMDSNTQEFSVCSLCSKKYRPNRKISISDTCGHIICQQCVVNYRSKSCQCCGRKCNYSEANPDIQKAVTQHTTDVVTFNVQDAIRAGRTWRVCMNQQLTLGDLVDFLQNQKGVTVQLLVISNKTYDPINNQDQRKKSFEEIGIHDGTIIRSVQRTRGGLAKYLPNRHRHYVYDG